MSILTTRRGCLAGAATLAIAGRAFGQQTQQVTIALASGSLASSTARLAHDLGLFAKHGLNPRFTTMEGGGAATTALISGSVRTAVSGPGELVAARARGQRIVAVARPYSGLGASVVISKAVADRLGVSPTAPVTERLRALDGLVFAVQGPTTISKVSLELSAAAAGATLRFTYMGQPSMAAALERGAIQGYSTGAPAWATPVVNGSGVLWLSGPKGEFPPQFVPASSALVQVMRDFAQANPDLMRRLVAVFADFGKAVDEQPAEVRAAVVGFYPNLDAQTIDLVLPSESQAWKSVSITAADMAHEIAYMKLSGMSLPQIDSVDPASLLFP